ncbi:hypothetical protein ACIOUE_35830 [Streptomyces xanthochromogenes]|uniref:hypothetical protein n=1 Tax=Streptomyces xanthochromogenes TaxID=67384 RepID=UPI00380690C0
MPHRRLLRRRPRPWTAAGHFRPGDQVHEARDAEYHEYLVPADVDRVNGRCLYLTTEHGEGWIEDQAVRHTTGCGPCTTDLRHVVEGVRLAEDAFWSLQPAGYRDLHARITSGLVRQFTGDRLDYSFGTDAPVPAWARAEFDGHLHPAFDTPTLDVAEVHDRLDWSRIVDAHPDELHLRTLDPGRPWPVVRQALVALEERRRPARGRGAPPGPPRPPTVAAPPGRRAAPRAGPPRPPAPGRRPRS